LVKEDVRLRLQVVRQHLERGTRTAEICRVFGISEATLRRWCRNYREEGVEGLRYESRRPHHSPNRIHGNLVNRILLAALGYYSHRHFAKIAGHGGFFVSRLKENADPLFVRSNTVHRGRAIDLEGEYLSEVLPHFDRDILDAPRRASLDLVLPIVGSPEKPQSWAPRSEKGQFSLNPD